MGSAGCGWLAPFLRQVQLRATDVHFAVLTFGLVSAGTSRCCSLGGPRQRRGSSWSMREREIQCHSEIRSAASGLGAQQLDEAAYVGLVLIHAEAKAQAIATRVSQHTERPELRAALAGIGATKAQELAPP